MDKLLKFIYGVVCSLFLIIMYNCLQVVGIIIVGFVNTGMFDLNEVYRIGQGIVATQVPWLCMVQLISLCVFAEIFIIEKKRNKYLIGFKSTSISSLISLCLLAIFLNVVVSSLINTIYPNEVGAAGTSTVRNMLKNYPISTIVCSGLLAPFIEEILFRSLILNKVRGYGFALAVSLSSALFGLVHGSVTQCVYAFIFGILFCVIDRHYHSIIPGIVMHCCINTTTLISQIIFINGGFS